MMEFSTDVEQERLGKMREVLLRHFGFDTFLTAQEEIILAVLRGEDILGVMPTGGGKSLCYQLPALVLEGVTIVVSPLIALMKDQVDGLQAKGISATLINSTLSYQEQMERIQRMGQGEYKLVYVAPERFRSERFLDALGKICIALFAVDEAHCISQWGHDFRPDYHQLSRALKRLGSPQVAAFTATATPEVREDIRKQLELREPIELVSGFARPNLQLRVLDTSSDIAKYEALCGLIESERTGIVYCATRKKVEAVTAVLLERGAKVMAYHGGMKDEEREEAQRRFLSREVDIAVATNAFGMGIDRPDIRFVAHFEIPGSVEAYYQEAGRAGRDGEPAVCELYFSGGDIRVQEFFIDGANPSRELIVEVYEFVRRRVGENRELQLSIREISEEMDAGGNEMAVGSALGHLQRIGAIERFDVPKSRVRGTRIVRMETRGHELPLDVHLLKQKEERDRAKLQAMMSLANTRICRQQFILRYFGEEGAEACRNCDVCLSQEAWQLRMPGEEEMVVLRKALSGVARASSRVNGKWVGRFGRQRIIQSLVGSRSRLVVEAGLHNISTYGILREFGNAYLQDLFKAMLEGGLIESTGGTYPVVTLTVHGNGVMRGEEECRLALPEMPEESQDIQVQMKRQDSSDFGVLGTMDSELLYALKRLRSEIAEKMGGRPAYLIFPDSVLEALARLRPASTEAALRIKGVGEFRARHVLPPFLELIQRWEESI